MGGLDWAGLPAVAALLGIEDLEWLVEMLTVVRDFETQRHG